jgi:hypothetical protein
MEPVAPIARLTVALIIVTAACSSGPSAQSTAEMCQSISTDYAAAVLKAEECTPGIVNPCTKPIAKTFYCRCMEYVAGDTTAAAALDAQFTAAQCMAGCLGSCIMESAASCVPDQTSSTGSRCMRSAP